MTSYPAPICMKCAHKRPAMKCAAFPDGIPRAIYSGQHDHHEPFPGDRGIRFEPAISTQEERP